MITAKIGALDKRGCFCGEGVLLCAAFSIEGVLHTWWFCLIGGGAFTLCVLDRGGAYDRHVVLLTERRCSYTLVFVRRGALHRDDVLFVRTGALHREDMLF